MSKHLYNFKMSPLNANWFKKKKKKGKKKKEKENTPAHSTEFQNQKTKFYFEIFSKIADILLSVLFHFSIAPRALKNSVYILD